MAHARNLGAADPAQSDAAYSPTAQQVNVVSNFLRAHGLSVESVADNNFYLKVSGTLAQAEKAFHVQINNYGYHGRTYRSNAADPSVAGSGSSNIAAVTGLDDASGYQPDLARAAGAAPRSALVYDVLCGNMNTTKTLSFTDGTSKTYQLNSSNFSVIAPNGTVNKHESRAQDPLGWQAEVTLDVEAVHAMAPGAKIVLVPAPNTYSDLDEAVNYVVVHHLANIVTNSWGLSTDLMSPGKASRDERIFVQAAAEGIGLDFSSGDAGDEQANSGVKSVDYPASSPWVTAVGGTSLFLHGDNGYNFETGWGTNLTKLGSCAASTTDPKTGLKDCNTYAATGAGLGVQGRAGGGLSQNFTAQPWQSAAIGSDTASGFGTVGTHRAVPDVSMLADPYTGMNVYITDLAAGDTAPAFVAALSQ